MAKFFKVQTNFTSGEISQSAVGRTDLVKYFNGVEELTNYVISKRGGIFPRPGTIYIDDLKDQDTRTRIFPFIFSTTQSFIIEAGDEYLRIYDVNNYTLLQEIVSPYFIDELDKVRYVQSASTMILVHPEHNPHKLQRFADNNWRISSVTPNLPALSEQGVKPNTTLALSALTGTITLTAGMKTFMASDVGRQISAGIGLGTVTAFTSNVSVDIESVIDFDANNYLADEWTLLDSPLTRNEPNNKDQGEVTTMVLLADGWRDNTWSFNDVGRYVRIDDGLVQITVVTDPTHADGNVLRQLTKVKTLLPAEPAKAYPGSWTVETEQWTDALGYPQTAGIYEGRLIFGGSPSFPNRIWGSNQKNIFDFYTGLNDSDPFEYDVASDRFDEITGIESAKQLVILTYGSEYAVNGRNDGPVGPLDTAIRRQSTYGSYNVEPTSIQQGLAFVQRNGQKVMFFAWDFAKDGFDAIDTTTLNDSITESGVTAVSYAQEPYQHLYCVTEDGDIGVLCIDPQESVTGWGRIRGANGTLFYDIATVSTASNDVTWCIARINGILSLCRFDYDSSLDGEITLTDSPTDSWTGLTHLANSVVDVVLDGQPFLGLSVDNAGALTTPWAGQELKAGYFFESRVKLLPVEEVVAGSMQGRQCSVSKIYVKVLETQTLNINAQQVEFRRFGNLVLDQEINAYTGSLNLSELGWGPDQTTIILKRTAPLKQTILSVNRETIVND